jgi:hypothetical protein
MFARLLLPLKYFLHGMCFLTLEPQKSENCTVRLHVRRRLLCFAWLLHKKACKMQSSVCSFLQPKYLNMSDIFNILQLQSHDATSECSSALLSQNVRRLLYVLFVASVGRSKISISKSTYLLPFAATNIQRSLLQSCFKMSPLLSNESLSSVISEHSK